MGHHQNIGILYNVLVKELGLTHRKAVKVLQVITEALKQAIKDGTVFFGRDHGAVLVTLPLHDRNGENIAAIRVKLKSFFTETQESAVTRAVMIQKKLEELCTTGEELRR